MKNCIVLLSGGQDSGTALFWAKQRFKDIHALSFDYGQKHVKELECATYLAGVAGVVSHVIKKVPDVFPESSLINHNLDHNDQKNGLPASFTPGRNILFFTIAGAMGYQLGICDFVSGVCQTDYSGYPDCRRAFVDSMEYTLRLGLGLREEIYIHTPMMHITKAETWKMAKELGVFELIRDHTVTDYNASETYNEWGYGDANNPASKLRMKGYFDAKAREWI